MAGVTRLTESISLGRSARRGRGLFATAHLGPGTPLIWDHRPLAATGGEPLGTTDGAKRICGHCLQPRFQCKCPLQLRPYQMALESASWRDFESSSAQEGSRYRVLASKLLMQAHAPFFFHCFPPPSLGLKEERHLACQAGHAIVYPDLSIRRRAARGAAGKMVRACVFGLTVPSNSPSPAFRKDDARTAMEVARASILEAKDLVNQEVEKCNVAVQEEGSKERLRYADEAIEALATLVDPIEVIKRCPLNALSFPDPLSNDESNGRGAALYDVPSFFNHSCRPNVAVKFSGAVVSFQVAEDAQIEAGEELFISYADDSSIGEALAPPASHQDGTLSSLENFLEWNYGISCRESCSCGKYGHSVKNPEILHATQVHQHRAEKSSAEEDVSLASTDAGASTRVSAKKVERIPSEIREKHAPKSVRTKKKVKKRR
eukprot:scaffold1217_cov250-Pinguiococcus_pyrenoidosus.AAC.2